MQILKALNVATLPVAKRTEFTEMIRALGLNLFVAGYYGYIECTKEQAETLRSVWKPTHPDASVFWNRTRKMWVFCNGTRTMFGKKKCLSVLRETYGVGEV